jgi:hypothetical protein
MAAALSAHRMVVTYELVSQSTTCNSYLRLEVTLETFHELQRAQTSNSNRNTEENDIKASKTRQHIFHVPYLVHKLTGFSCSLSKQMLNAVSKTPSATIFTNIFRIFIVRRFQQI